MPSPFAACNARSISQIAPSNAKIYRFGSDQDARLAWLWHERITAERFMPKRDRGVSRRSAIIRKMSPNRLFGVATSAIWKVT
jgi:hypothetical protein